MALRHQRVRAEHGGAERRLEVIRRIAAKTTTGANGPSLINFYDAQLESRGWNLFSSGASNGDPQSLFQKAGSDGFYWVIGVTVTTSNAARVDWTFRIYQNSETI